MKFTELLAVALLIGFMYLVYLYMIDSSLLFPVGAAFGALVFFYGHRKQEESNAIWEDQEE